MFIWISCSTACAEVPASLHECCFNQQAIPNSDSSSLWHPLFKQIFGNRKNKSFFFNSKNLGFIRQRLENHLYRALFSLLLCFHSTYLPETPSLGAGRHGLHQTWVNISQVSAQFCIFTLPATTAGRTRGTLCGVTHADESVSNAGLMLTPKISLSRMQKRQTSCRAWVTRLTVD